MEGDEAGAVGALAAPDQGGGQLQGARRPAAVMDGKDAQGAGAQLLGGLDLEGPRPQVVEHRPGLLEVGGGDPLPPLGGEQGLASTRGAPPTRRPPPGSRCKRGSIFSEAGSRTASARRAELSQNLRRPPAAPRAPGSSRSSSDRRRGGTRYSPRGSFQNVSSSRFSGALHLPHPHQLLGGRGRRRRRQRQDAGDRTPMLGDQDLLARLHPRESFGKQRLQLGNSHGSHAKSLGRRK